MILNILIVSLIQNLEVLEDLNYLPEEVESYAHKPLTIVSNSDFSRPFQQLDICSSHQWEDLNQKETIEGVEYQVIVRDVTSDSHPVYTGEKRFVDTAGRVEKFQNKFRRRR